MVSSVDGLALVPPWHTSDSYAFVIDFRYVVNIFLHQFGRVPDVAMVVKSMPSSAAWLGYSARH